MSMNRLDATTLKKDFPIFNNVGEGLAFAYLDTAATSQTPKVVLDAMEAYYTGFRANIHRGLYAIGEQATNAYEDTRKIVAGFINAEPQEVIFTSGATMSSNMLVLMLERGGVLKVSHEVLVSVMEHHASLIPLQEVAVRQGLVLKHIPREKGGVGIDYQALGSLITKHTKIVSVTLASNVTGKINDIARIAKMAHAVGAMVVCDATAAVGHMSVDVKALGVDFLYFSGHKMCGPTGVGVLWGKREILETLPPGMYGGGIVERVLHDHATWRGIPERFEAGTPNIAGVIGLGAAVSYLKTIELGAIHAHTAMLVNEAIKRLEEIPGVRVYAERDGVNNIGIVSFIVEGVHPHDLADILGRSGVAIRAGHHCAEPLVADLGLTALARASFYLYNTLEDVDALVNGVKKAQEIFKI